MVDIKTLRRILRFRLQWPNLKVLGGNSRVKHNTSQHKKARDASRNDAFYSCRKAIGRERFGTDNLHVTMTFQEPTAHRRDMDGLIRATKYAQDGIALALQVDDYYFSNTYIRGHDRIEPGWIDVEIVRQDALAPQKLIEVVGYVE